MKSLSADQKRELFGAAIATTPVQLQLQTKPAVVLERIAFGGGRTNWYYCNEPGDIAKLAENLSSGSVVSFYFDQRIKRAEGSAGFESDVMRIVRETGDAVVGTYEDGSLIVAAQIVTGPNDLADLLNDVGPSTRILFGAVPGCDNDGENAVTLVLPDSDGVLRNHPH